MSAENNDLPRAERGVIYAPWERATRVLLASVLAGVPGYAWLWWLGRKR